MKRRWLTTILCLGLLAACGSDGDDSGDEASAPSTPESTATHPEETSPSSDPTPEQLGTEIVVEESDYGPVLFDDSGQAAYVFDVETTDEPRCYGPCATAWPPVLTDGRPVAGKGAKQTLLGTTERNDGSAQVTYAGHPLYFYAHEGKHVVECHDIVLNGGTWYAVQADGDRAP